MKTRIWTVRCLWIGLKSPSKEFDLIRGDFNSEYGVKV